MTNTHYDAVVVGSGFGGSVMAYKLARANLRVRVLERGKIYPPFSFPRSPHEMSKNFWDPSEGLYGMFDVWTFRGSRWSLKGIEAVVGSGLGGGSLIYANVLLRKDRSWFVKEDLDNGGYEYWPITRDDLEPHYDEAEKMLGAQRYPFEEYEPYNATSKTEVFRRLGSHLGLEWGLPPLAVTFGNKNERPIPGVAIHEEQPNLHHKERYTCRLCGECDIGCNYGSKNTLDFNYLSDAQRMGAEISALSEVRTFRPGIPGSDDGYTITFVQHEPQTRQGAKMDTSELPEHTITADRLILSAGTLGSTYLLLRMKDQFPNLSEQLGTRFSGNGDLLSFMVNCRENKDGELVPRIMDPSRGPAITSYLRSKDELDGGPGRGFYIEDAGYPAFLSWIIEMNAPSAVRRVGRMVVRRLWNVVLGIPASNLSGEISRVFGTGALSSSSLPMLGMGRDVPDGRLWLDGRYLNSDWTIAESKPYFRRLRKTMRRIAKTLRGKFVDNPIWGLSRVITVHPLGGCPMGRNRDEGVVDTHGRVFGYPGLYVADGSVMPGPVGPNPSLTIAAVASRFADGVIADAAASSSDQRTGGETGLGVSK